MDFLWQGNCSTCGRSTRLEASVDGRDKVCKKCLIEQFEAYKRNKLDVCSQIENEIGFYKQKIESLTPKLNENLFNINHAIDEIEHNYNLLVRSINLEKAELLRLANECKKDNTKFFEFKNELNQVASNLNAFKDPSQNLYDDNAIRQLMNNFEQSTQLAQNMRNKYANLTSAPIKTVEKYERGALGGGVKLLGNIYTTSSASLSSPNYQYTDQGMGAVKSAIRELAPTLSSAKQTSGQFDHSNYEKWMALSNQSPTLTLNSYHNPVYLVSHRNQLFSINEKFECVIMTVNNTNDFEQHASFKIPVPNVRSVAVSERYFAITYSDLDKEKSFLKKNKTFKPHGVVLYQRNFDMIDVNIYKSIELDRGDFKSPVGIALDDSYVYVCDEKLKAVFKIDIKTGTSDKIDFEPGAEPYKLAVNKDYLIVTDTAQHLLNVYDVKTLKRIKNLSVKHPKGNNGPFSVLIGDDNSIFFKNFADSQVTSIDINLNNHRVFSQVQLAVQGMTLIECSNTHKLLCLGCVKEKNKYCLLCYIIS